MSPANHPADCDTSGEPAANGTADRLLATAAGLFRTKGYSATGIREIAARLGIQSASLYHHVGKKEDLLYELCVDTYTRALEGLQEAVSRESDPIERIRALIRAHVTTNLAHQDGNTVALLEQRALSSERRAEVLRLRRAYEAEVRRVIEDEQTAGVLRTDIPAKYLTLGLLAMLNWPVFWYRPEGELTPTQIADHVATMFLDASCQRDEHTRRPTGSVGTSGSGAPARRPPRTAGPTSAGAKPQRPGRRQRA